MAANPNIARGPGPGWLRIVLIVVAATYFLSLLKHPPDHVTVRGKQHLGWLLRPVLFFSQSTSLFPSADRVITEFRLEGWSCATHDWQPLDPRPYFPIEADDKESRFQRLGYFYRNNLTVMLALEDFIIDHHAADGADDGITGPIGGIRLRHLRAPLPYEPSGDVPRYHYEPLAPMTPDPDHKNYYMPSEFTARKARCQSVR